MAWHVAGAANPSDYFLGFLARFARAVNTCDRLKSEALALRLGLLFAAIIAIQNLLAAVWVNADTPLPVG